MQARAPVEVVVVVVGGDGIGVLPLQALVQMPGTRSDRQFRGAHALGEDNLCQETNCSKDEITYWVKIQHICDIKQSCAAAWIVWVFALDYWVYIHFFHCSCYDSDVFNCMLLGEDEMPEGFCGTVNTTEPTIYRQAASCHVLIFHICNSVHLSVCQMSSLLLFVSPFILFHLLPLFYGPVLMLRYSL